MAAGWGELIIGEKLANAREYETAGVPSVESHPPEPNPSMTVRIVSEYDLVGGQRDPEAARKQHERARWPVSDHREIRASIPLPQEGRR